MQHFGRVVDAELLEGVAGYVLKAKNVQNAHTRGQGRLLSRRYLVVASREVRVQTLIRPAQRPLENALVDAPRDGVAGGGGLRGGQGLEDDLASDDQALLAHQRRL